VALREVISPVSLRLICLLVSGHVAFTGSRFTLTLQAVALQASPAAIGLMMSLMMVLPMLMAVHIGRWSDRYGYARPAATGFALLAAGGLLAGLMPTLPALCVASVLVGSGYMLAHVAVNNAIGHASAGTGLTHAFSLLAMGFSLSGMTGPLIAGFAIDRLGHAVAFIGLVAFALLSLALLRGTARRAPVAARHADPQAPSHVMDLLRHAPLRAVFIVSGLLSMGWDMFTFLVPLHGARVGLSATAIGLLMGAFGAGTFAIRLFLPALAVRASEWRTLSGAMFVTAACYLAFPFATTLPFLLPAAFAMGLSLGCGQPMAMSLLHLSAPAARAGEAVGVRSAITSASQTLLPLIFGAMGSALGVAAVFWTAATVLASGGAFARRHR